MAFLDSVEIENFKSFRGKNRFKLRNFTAVSDVHGQGKSHFFEALMFVFAHKKTKIPDIIKECKIHRLETDEFSISVEVQFVLPSDRCVTFRRKIINEATSRYEVNDTHVSKRDYVQELKNVEIDLEILDLLNGDMPLNKPIRITELLEIVSGSGKLKDRYDELAKGIEQVNEKLKLESSDKMVLAAKMKLMKHKFEQWQGHENHIRNLAQMKHSYFLTVLYHLDKELAHLNDEVNKIKSTVPAFRQDSNRQMLQKRLKELEREMLDLLNLLTEKNETVKMHPRICEELKRREILSKGSLKSARERQECIDKEMTLHDNQLREVEEIEAGFVEKDSLGDEGQRLLLKFNTLDLDVKKATAIETKKLQTLTDDCEMREVLMNASQRKIDSIVSVIKEKFLEVEKTQSRCDTWNELVERKMVEKEKAARVEDNKRTVEDLKMQFKDLSNRMIAEADDCNRIRKRELYNQEIEEELKTRFGHKVFGRVSRVCRPKRKEFDVAFMIIFGKYIDAIVVDSERTALQCMEHLKSLPDKTQSEKFIPVNSLELRPIRTALRNIQDPSHTILALDALDFPEELRPAVLFITRNYVICRSNGDAVKLAYDVEPSLRADAVSLSGMCCFRKGIVAYSSESCIKTSKWIAQDLANLEKQMDQIKSDIKNLVENINACGITESTEVLNYQIKQALQERNNTLREVSLLKTEIHSLEEKLKRERNELESRNIALNTILNDKKILEENVKRARNEYFREFCEEMGVDSYDALEKKVSIWMKSANYKEVNQSLKKRIIEQLKFDSETKTQNARKIARWEDNLTEINDQLNKLNNERSTNLAEIENLNEKKEYLQTIRKQLVKEIDDLQNGTPADDSSVKKLNKLTRAISNKSQHRRDVLMQCKTDNIPICALNESGNVTQFTEEDVASGRIRVDYSSLGERYKNMSSRSLRKYTEETEEHIFNAIQALSDVCDTRVEQVDLEKQRVVIKKSEACCKELNTKLREKNAELVKIKAERYEKFITCFNRVSHTAKLIYQKLNQHGSNSDFHLLLHNPVEPYLDGTELSCVPANKLFLPFQSLSSGEKGKALASMFLALFEFWPGPFMIFEGLEINLDLTSVDIFGQCIRKLVDDTENVQVVVISSKEKFICHADRLVGFYRDEDENNSTKTICLDLK